MKKAIKFLLVLATGFIFAQNVSDYQYIFVPSNFTDFNGNKFNLRKVLISKLTDKGYTVIDEKVYVPPAESFDRCSMLNADVLKTSSMLRNKITVVFKDCNGKEVLKNEGSSYEKDYDIGYPEALVAALNSVKYHQPVMIDDRSSELNDGKIAVTSVETVQKIETSKPMEPAKVVVDTEKKSSETKAVSSLIEEFINNGKVYRKIAISSSEFILASPTDSVAKAIFKESGKAGVYHVKFDADTRAFGYVEGNSFVVEVPLSDGSFKKEVFEKK